VPASPGLVRPVLPRRRKREGEEEGGGDVASAFSLDIGRSVKKFDGVKKNWSDRIFIFVSILMNSADFL
jgi:hypothetical protein